MANTERGASSPPPHSPFAIHESPPRAGADHEVVEGVLGDLPPEVLLVAEGPERIVHLLEVGVLPRDLVIDLVRGLERRFKDFLAERPQLRAGADEAAQRSGIASVVFRG